MSLAPVSQSPNNVINAIFRASRSTGADFDYLVRTASRESGLRTHVNSSTSTAAGPFQFIEQTWFSTLKEHGQEHGLGAYAGAIEQGANGRYHVANPAQREEILALRHDARASALMAGELTNDASRSLERTLGRDLRENEPYVAHFMGLGGATRLIREVDASPTTVAADLFPRAASANPAIFNNADGSARTVAEVYANLTTLPEVDTSGHRRPAATRAATQAASLATLPVSSMDVAATPRAAARSALTAPAAPVGNSVGNFRQASAPGSYTSLLTPQVIELLSLLDPSAAFGDKENNNDRYRSRMMDNA